MILCLSGLLQIAIRHFNHQNIIAYCPESRPFKTVAEMNEAIIQRWNSVVKEDDTVIHCGDFFMGQNKEIEPILSKLNGKIILVRGNHDSKARREIYEKNGVEVHDIFYLPYKGRFFIFCHFPISNEEFMRMVREDNSECILVYGHVHDNAPSGLVDGTFHAGVDTNDLTPVSLHHIWEMSRVEEEKKNIPAVVDPICTTCAMYFPDCDKLKCHGCKGQDGGCSRYKSK